MKRILIALCGKTPQIVTEALYALHRQGRFPSRVVILTTETGRKLCLSHLLHPERGHMARLLADTGQSSAAPLMTEADLLTPSRGAGRAVVDIETEEDSRAFFEFCLRHVFELARDRHSELLFSIAGGRKTMSAALALTAQCYARPQDSMFHVLVPPEQESDPTFFYPRPPHADVPVTLTPVPFFRLRDLLPPEMVRSPASLDLLRRVCIEPAPLQVTLDFQQRSICCEGRTCVLPPALFAVYAFFALERKPCARGARLCPASCRGCALTWADIAARRGEIARLYQQVEAKALARGQRGILQLSAENFRSSLAKLKQLLTQAFGAATGTRLSVVSERRDGAAGYCLRIPKGCLRGEPQRCDR